MIDCTLKKVNEDVGDIDEQIYTTEDVFLTS